MAYADTLDALTSAVAPPPSGPDAFGRHLDA